ncbi:MAG: hypothetical protein ACE5I5_17220 [Candidatus Heimdallarchaeota archaeon]
MGAHPPIHAKIGGQIRGSGGTFNGAGHQPGVSGQEAPPAALQMVTSRTP